FPFFRLSEKRFERLRLLVDDMHECLAEQPVFYDLLRAELWQFIFLAEKEYVIDGNQGRKDNNPNYIARFINLVNSNFTSHHDPAFYADKLSITPNYLNKIVKKATGYNTRDYIMNRIMSEASYLLRLTPVNVNQLAERMGFDDPNYFIRCYKKIKGITPREFQKKGTL
ncbi:MAG: helix-turn-helix transcriptional regulator, partial [Muribaculaceae bacterium]|nr:helix-turn-helix transcriptional regulator [Muribaculaceae bacterium]